jgi:hypothetical protein
MRATVSDCAPGRDRAAGDSDAAAIEASWLDPERFAVLFDRHADEIHRYAARRLGQQAAADVVSEVFLMRSYLLRQVPHGTRAYRILAAIADLQQGWPSGYLVPNSSYALMFRAAATVPGIRLIRHATAASGRRGSAVAACEHGTAGQRAVRGAGCAQRIELIFAAHSYAFIGEDQPVLHGRAAPGTAAAAALLRVAVVRSAGQLP